MTAEITTAATTSKPAVSRVLAAAAMVAPVVKTSSTKITGSAGAWWLVARRNFPFEAARRLWLPVPRCDAWCIICHRFLSVFASSLSVDGSGLGNITVTGLYRLLRILLDDAGIGISR